MKVDSCLTLRPILGSRQSESWFHYKEKMLGIITFCNIIMFEQNRSLKVTNRITLNGNSIVEFISWLCLLTINKYIKPIWELRSLVKLYEWVTDDA